VLFDGSVVECFEGFLLLLAVVEGSRVRVFRKWPLGGNVDSRFLKGYPTTATNTTLYRIEGYPAGQLLLATLQVQKTSSIKFCLVEDDFLVESCDPTHTEHLKATLREHYTITEDAAASRFCRSTLDWDYRAGHVDISMPGYFDKALHKFTHSKPTSPQHAPSKWSAINYGARSAINYGAPVQYADPGRLKMTVCCATAVEVQWPPKASISTQEELRRLAGCCA
jgi:hypothetical protein